MSATLGERLLTTRREAIAAARALAEAHQHLADMYEVLQRRLETQISAGESEDSTALRVRVRAQRVLVRAAVSKLVESEDEAVVITAQLARSAGVPAESLEDDEVAVSLKKALAEALTEERRDVRRALNQDEWRDLPEYHGADSRTRDYCLHCGEELQDNKKTFCSVHCRDVHQSVFGALEGESSDEVDEA